jgi:hypothetical protein
VKAIALRIAVVGIIAMNMISPDRRLSVSSVVYAAEQEVGSMQPGTRTLFASQHTPAGTSISGVRCIPLKANASASTGAATYVVLQQLRSHSTGNGPYSVYLEPSGTARRLQANLLGSFSLYSLEIDKQTQDVSFRVEAPLLRRLTAGKQPSGFSDLQICIVDRSPGATASPSQSQSPTASVERVLVVEMPTALSK